MFENRTDAKRRRRVVLGAGGLAVVLLIVGAVLQNQANFSNDYVKRQLGAHGISFTPIAALTPAQQKVPCLVKDAGKPLVTGKQAECYALYQIGIDLTLIDHGKSYFQDHYNGYLMRQKMYAALKNDPNSPATQALVQQATTAQRTADDLLAGEATRGLLLTAYGFSILGERAGQAALACFSAAGLLILALLGWAAMSRRRRVTITASSPRVPRSPDREVTLEPAMG